MQLVDRQGFLIIDEIPTVSLQFHDAALNAAHLRLARQLLEALIARDKNHPSVIMCSVANEPLPPVLPALVPGGQPNAEAEAAGKQFLDSSSTTPEGWTPPGWPRSWASWAGHPNGWPKAT
jgi:beta-galactosidase/beta-glucuronidase